MKQVAGFPYWEIQFTQAGEPDAKDEEQLLQEIGQETLTDLLVISHGWRNDLDDARALYAELLGNMSKRLDAMPDPPGNERRFGIAAVLWPSLKFAEPGALPNAVPGATAAMGDSADVPASLLEAKVQELGQALSGQKEGALERASQAVRHLGNGALPDGTDPRQALVESLRELLPHPTDISDDASDELMKADWKDLFNNLREPLNIVDTGGEGGVASVNFGAASVAGDPQGEAAGLASMFSGIRATAWRILNYATYYLMKERAGTVGTGLNSVLGRIRDKYPDLRIHLVGHSFGARLVTAAAAGPDLFAPSSMSLLQAAYSHNALGPGTPLDQVPEGFFRRIIVDERIRGPIIATHTQNDQAVGVAYAIASRLSGDVATDFGGPTDRFGGIGRNGAVRMGEGEVVGATLHDGHFDYGPWPAGKVTNLKADEFISCHGDVRNPAVANAVLNAARS